MQEFIYRKSNCGVYEEDNESVADCKWSLVTVELSSYHSVFGWFEVAVKVLTSISICFQISGRNTVNEDVPKLLAGPEASIKDR